MVVSSRCFLHALMFVFSWCCGLNCWLCFILQVFYVPGSSHACSIEPLAFLLLAPLPSSSPYSFYTYIHCGGSVASDVDYEFEGSELNSRNFHRISIRRIFAKHSTLVSKFIRKVWRNFIQNRGRRSIPAMRSLIRDITSCYLGTRWTCHPYTLNNWLVF